VCVFGVYLLASYLNSGHPVPPEFRIAAPPSFTPRAYLLVHGWTGLADFLFDAVFVSSAYASSFAGFLEIGTSMWFGAGGIIGSAWNTVARRRQRGTSAGELPEDMSATSLVGGGLIQATQ